MPLTSINFGPVEADLAHKKQALHRAAQAADRTQKLANEFAPTGFVRGLCSVGADLSASFSGGRPGAAGRTQSSRMNSLLQGSYGAAFRVGADLSASFSLSRAGS